MVKGLSRQVIIVKGSKTKLFDQAIFLVRDDVLAEGGVTEEALLQQARMVCREPDTKSSLSCFLWSFAGAAVTGAAWLLTLIF